MGGVALIGPVSDWLADMLPEEEEVDTPADWLDDDADSESAKHPK